jgi:hypothetical protein
MLNRRFALVAGAIALLVSGAMAAEPAVKSGPQVGETVPGPFHPLNVTGEYAGKKQCLYCLNGLNPVAMIFAREPSDTVATLIKKVDEATAKNKTDKMGSFVVFLGDADGLEKKLKDMASKENIKETVLSIDNPAGPEKYEVSKDADVTVVLYVEGKVKANYAFKKGDLKQKDIDAIISDVAKILPKK